MRCMYDVEMNYRHFVNSVDALKSRTWANGGVDILWLQSDMYMSMCIFIIHTRLFTNYLQQNLSMYQLCFAHVHGALHLWFLPAF